MDASQKRDTIKRKCILSDAADEDTMIDWTDRLDDNHSYDDRFADAYMGKTFQSDMIFFLESCGTSIPAHTLIVSAASAVLERFVRQGSGGTGKTDRIVQVPDCSLAEFTVLLRYIYTGQLRLCELY